MAIGFPARYSRFHSYSASESELVASVKTALSDLGWSYEVQWGTEFHATPERSPLTWGEELRIKVGRDGVIAVESRCAGARLQVFDFGKNKQNVERFFARLDKELGR